MCKSCEVLNINGINCHETDCPEAWKESIRECKQCGREFSPKDEYQECCSDECFDNFYN